MRKLVIIFVAALAFTTACDRKSAEQKTYTSEVLTDSVKTHILAVKDSMNTAWEQMIKSDDEKFQSINRLLQEVSYTKKFDLLKHKNLLTMADSIKKSRFTFENMSGEMVDKFDLGTDSLVLLVFALVESTPEMASHTITEPLKNDIQAANSVETILPQRTKYDFWAMEYNNLIKKYKDQFKQAGEPFSSLKEAPTFTIQNGI